MVGLYLHFPTNLHGMVLNKKPRDLTFYLVSTENLYFTTASKVTS
jgi:hypothetical protein